MFFQQEKHVDLLLPVFTPRSEHFFAKSKKRKEIDVFFLSLFPTVASGLSPPIRRNVLCESDANALVCVRVCVCAYVCRSLSTSVTDDEYTP